MPDFPSLPRDVLELILERLTAKEALQLSRTNKWLNSIAVFHILREVTVTMSGLEGILPPEGSSRTPGPIIGDLDQLESFATFVLSNPNLYARCMLTIKYNMIHPGDEMRIETSERVTTVPTLLVQVLRCAHGLQRLCIDNVGQLTLAIPEILDAVCELERLDYVELGWIQTTQQLALVLPLLRSRPSEMILRAALLDTHFRSANILEYLIPHANTLQRLTIRYAILERVVDRAVTWPRVESVTLAGMNIRLPRNYLPGLFPNARQVNLDGIAVLDGTMEWPGLDSLSMAASVPLITSRVRKVKLGHFISRDGFDSLAWTRPTILSYSPHYFAAAVPQDDLRSVAWCTSVRYLRLHDIMFINARWDFTFVRHLEIISSTPLRHQLTALCLHWCIGSSTAPPPLDTWQRTIQMLVVDHFPKLDYVGFVSQDSSEPDNVDAASSWYRRVAPGEGACPTPIFERVPQSEVFALTSMLEELRPVEA